MSAFCGGDDVIFRHGDRLGRELPRSRDVLVLDQKPSLV